MACSLDGTVRSSSGAATSLSPTLTCTQSNNVIIVCLVGNGTLSPYAVPTATGLTFTQRATINADPFATVIWWAPSTGIFNGAITVTQNTSTTMVVDCFGVHGAGNINSPFDGTAIGSTSATYPSYTNTNANCMVFGSDRDQNLNPANNGSWLNIQDGNNNVATGYQVISAVQSTTMNVLGSNPFATIIDAITSDIVAGPTITLMGAICL